MGQENIYRVDETLIAQDVDPADLEDPAWQKADLARNIEGN